MQCARRWILRRSPARMRPETDGPTRLGRSHGPRPADRAANPAHDWAGGTGRAGCSSGSSPGRDRGEVHPHHLSKLFVVVPGELRPRDLARPTRQLAGHRPGGLSPWRALSARLSPAPTPRVADDPGPMPASRAAASSLRRLAVARDGHDGFIVTVALDRDDRFGRAAFLLQRNRYSER